MKKNLIKRGAILGMVLTMLYASTASATAVVTQKLGSLNELVLGIVTAAGVIVLAWGIFEFATAYQSHELEYVLGQSEMKAIAMTDGFRDTTAPQIINLLK